MSLLCETMKKAFTILFAGEFGLASMSSNLLLAFVLSHTITGLYAAVQNWGLKELKARRAPKLFQFADLLVLLVLLRRNGINYKAVKRVCH